MKRVAAEQRVGGLREIVCEISIQWLA